MLYASFHPTAREARRAALESAPEPTEVPPAEPEVVMLDQELVDLLGPDDDLEEPQPPWAQHA